MRFRRRAYLYITRTEGRERQLLVFAPVNVGHDWVSGEQVPGGTIEPGEDVDQAALREAFEETGLRNFESARYLIGDEFVGLEVRLERHFFQLELSEPAPRSWEHQVTAGTGDKGHIYRHYWVGLPEAEGLSEHFRAYLHLVE